MSVSRHPFACIQTTYEYKYLSYICERYASYINDFLLKEYWKTSNNI
jgi:hypothetical protein